MDPSKGASAAWQRLLERERQLRREALEGAEKPGDSHRFRTWWAIVADVLQEYARLLARRQNPSPPAELIISLGGLAGYLAVGTIPRPIERVALRGRKKPGPSEQRDIRLAVAYRLACRTDGLEHNQKIVRIVDPTPVKTLQSWYEVDKRTIQQWVGAYPPAFLGVNDIDGAILVSLTKKAAVRYRKAGRSASAIAKRDAKAKA